MPASWWNRLVTLAKTDPAAVVAAVQAALALAVTLGLTLTPGETGAIEGGTTAVLGLIVAIYTRPFRTGAITALAAAAGTILLAFRVPGITGPCRRRTCSSPACSCSPSPHPRPCP